MPRLRHLGDRSRSQIHIREGLGGGQRRPNCDIIEFIRNGFIPSVVVLVEKAFALKPLVVNIPAFSKITVVEQCYRADTSLFEGFAQLIVPVNGLVADRVYEILECLSIEYDSTLI